MGTHQEANVRLPPCAFDGLTCIAARRKVFRNEAVRQVLSVHLAEQEARELEDRITHFSTVDQRE
ncbi:hypothetical protein ACVDFE_22980 [Lentzea chajnantorensis]